MDKTYNPKSSEEKWYKFWQDNGYFKAGLGSSKKSYSLLMPPPNLTGELHMGHAMQHSILDAIARFKRMQGYDVLLLPGVDHAGIQFEATLDRQLSKENLSKRKLGREKWLERAWKFKEEVYNSVRKTWTFMGISADWDREVFTLDPKIKKAVFEEFKKFWDEDLLYKGAYIVQWCPKCGTAIEDIEMDYEEKKEKLYYVKYQIAFSKGKEFITVATARPETIYADVAIAVHPDDPRYKHFVGRTAYKPLYEAKGVGGPEIKIITDSRVDRKFGTGALKITPGHDPLDYEIGKDNNLLILHAIDKTDRMTDLAEELEGMKVQEAREKAVEKLQHLGAISKIEDYAHSVPICERCKSTVEPLISEEWFLKIEPLKQAGLKEIKKINFAPKNYKKILSDWLEEVHDWSISRSLWWGHRIPVWYCKNCNPNRNVGKNEDMTISLKKPNNKCKTCGNSEWVQDEQVLDTWFSSGMWPISTLGWPDETKELKRYFPWDFEITAPEIKYLWIARMIMLAAYFKNDIPFKNMFFHGMLRDLQGRKFSKSLGNGIDPNELKNEWGTDSLRMTLYSYSAPGRDSRVSKQTMSERAKNFRNFNNKLWNIARFIIDLKPEGVQSLKPNSKIPINWKEDKEILGKLARLKTYTTKSIENYKLHLAIGKLYDFIWHEFADKYIEKSKTRRLEAQPVLEDILLTCLKLLHPFAPFITEEIYQKMPGHKESLMIEKWPFDSSSISLTAGAQGEPK